MQELFSFISFVFLFVLFLLYVEAFSIVLLLRFFEVSEIKSEPEGRFH